MLQKYVIARRKTKKYIILFMYPYEDPYFSSTQPNAKTNSNRMKTELGRLNSACASGRCMRTIGKCMCVKWMKKKIAAQSQRTN